MKSIFILLAILVTTLTTCHAAEKDVESKTLKNEKPESLDVSNNFRKALLEALEQLEKDEKSTSDSTNEKDDLDASDYDEIGRMKFGHKVRGNISKQEAIVTSFTDADKSNVFIHSFTTNDPISKPSKEPKKPVEKSNKIEATTIKYRAKLTSDNSLVTSASSTIAANNKILPKPTKKETSTAPVTPETKLTSPNPTISTPVEEEDETKQKVEDVQFIHAPLVAAFTVEQDDKGLPRKVIPIYGNKQPSTNSQFSNQNSVNRFQASLDEKQRQLEQQIRILQEQRRQHELLLIRQQSLQNQQLPHNFQKQNFLQQSFISEQNPINSNQFQSQSQDFRQHRTTEQQNRINIPIPLQNTAKPSTSRPTKEVSGTVVAFQPSIVFQPNSFNQVQKQQFNQGLNKPSSQFNQELLQKPSTQFSQSLNPNPSTQFNQNFNSPSQFTQNQNQFAQFHQQVDQIQGNLEGFIQNPPTQLSQSLKQTPSNNINQKPSTEFIQSISLTTDNQFTPINTRNPSNQFTSSGQFNQGFITPTQAHQALPQPAALTQFNTASIKNSASNQFNSGFNPTAHFNQETAQNQYNQLQFSQTQGLPIKPAIDFQKAVSIPISNPATNVNQQQIPNKFRDNAFNNINDNYIQDFLYRQRTLIPPPPRTNRFNRHETQVGNFGVNDFSQNKFVQNQQFQQPFTPINYNNQQFRQNQFFTDQRNNFNNFNNRPHQNNQFFNSNLVKQSNVDNRLKNLIYQSGLGQGRGQEDLNIVSKVLSLDHTGNFQQNLLFGASKVNERRVPYTQANKTFKT